MLSILVWFLLTLLCAVGTGARTVAALVRDLQSTVRPANVTRVQRMHAAAGIVSALAMVGATAWIVFEGARVGSDAVIVALLAGFSTAALILTQSFARRYARRNLERLAEPLLGDAVVFLSFVEPTAETLEPEEVRDETLEQMVDATEKVGLIESDEREMIAGILQLDRTVTREIMVPRIDVIALDVETSLQDALKVVIDGAHSRVPIYEESIDHIIGVLYAKDLLRTMGDEKADHSMRGLMRAAHFVPETKRVDELLQELQSAKVHMAIVVDEYGGTAGIVTIEDVLEEIVGEIQDEYDTSEEALIERVTQNEGVFNARVSIDDANEALSISLPNESDTLGGLVYQYLQKMPKVGDEVRVGDVNITVLSVVGRRIKRVQITKLENQEPESVKHEGIKGSFNED